MRISDWSSDVCSSDLVYKSADASLIAAGISGTVDLRMLRPLERGERVVALSARGQMNGIDNLNPDSSRYGYRASATYIDQFAGATLGIALGVSAAQTPSQDERYHQLGRAGGRGEGGRTCEARWAPVA